MPSMTQAGYTPPKAPEKKTQKKKPSASRKKRRKKAGIGAAAVISLVIFLLACVIGAGTIYVYTQTAPYADTFLPGTMLLGYPLGGATMQEAYELLDKITNEDVSGWSAELVWDTQSYVLSASDVRLTVDGEATLSDLWQRGRQSGMLGRFVEMLRMRSEPMIAQPIVTYDMAAADELLTLIEQDIACQPEDATVAFTPGSAQPFAFTAESIGFAIDLTDARAQIERALASVEPVVIALEPEVIMPDVVLEDLQNAVVLRSRVLMEISGDEAAYSNVSLAAAALDGARIDPGQTCSFNETVGARTAARGYLPADEPAYGEGVSGVGGGVCQASSALYRLALLGGIGVAERSAAVYPVDYCEMGQEAAVSDQGIDLVIENTTGFPLFLTARTYESDGGAYLEMQLIGEALEGSYALFSGVLAENIIEEPVYVRDHEGRYARYDDERVPVGEGRPGYTVEVHRATLDAEENEILRELVSTNEYDPVPPAIYVGVDVRE